MAFRDYGDLVGDGLTEQKYGGGKTHYKKEIFEWNSWADKTLLMKRIQQKGA